MTSDYFMKPSQMLQEIRTLSKNQDIDVFDDLQKLGLSINYKNNGLEARVRFAFPRSRQSLVIENDSIEPFLKKISKSSRQIPSKELISFSGSSIGWLLLNCQTDKPKDSAIPIPELELNIIESSSISTQMEIFDSINWHSSDMQLCIKEKNDRSLINLFLISDKKSHLSIFSIIKFPDEIGSVNVLYGYKIEDKIIYISGLEYPINRDSLQDYYYILLERKSFFGIKEDIESETNDLVALYPVNDQQGNCVINTIPNLIFQHRMRLWPSLIVRENIEIYEHVFNRELEHELVKNLALEIERSELKTSGYKLSFRENRAPIKTSNDISKIDDEIIYLEEQRRELLKIDGNSKRLLRFSQQQLNFLIKELITIHPNDLEHILYCFHGVTNFEAPIDRVGHHYLLIDLDKVKFTETGIEYGWLFNEECSFVLDPHWNNKKLDSMIFVPKGFSLYPAWVDWQDDLKNKYIIDVMKSFFPTGTTEISDRPIYLFERFDDCSLDDIKLRVLDFNNFVPLLGTDKGETEKSIAFPIKWMNSNIRIFDSDESITSLLTEIASWESKNNKISFLRDESQSSSETYDLLTEDVKRIASNAYTELEKVEHHFLQQLDELVESINNMTNAIESSNAKVKDLSDVIEEQDALEVRNNKHFSQAHAERKILKKSIEKEVAVLNAELIRKNRSVCENIENSIQACFDNCSNRMRRLRNG